MQLKLYNEDFVRKTDSEQIYFYSNSQGSLCPEVSQSFLIKQITRHHETA